jgi:hypothetical protein
VLFVLACFQASAAPRPENSYSVEKDALFALDTQITILFSHITEFMQRFLQCFDQTQVRSFFFIFRVRKEKI